MRDSRRFIAYRSHALAFMVALSPAFLQTLYSCERGDTYLLSLELEVSGQNQVDAFNINNREYDITVSASTAVLRAVARDPNSTVTYQLIVDGVSIESGAMGVGGGEATVQVPPGQSELRVNVRAALPETAVGAYVLRVDNADVTATAPLHGAFINGASVNVQGALADILIDPDTDVEVNGVGALVNPDGTWTATVPLDPAAAHQRLAVEALRFGVVQATTQLSIVAVDGLTSEAVTDGDPATQSLAIRHSGVNDGATLVDSVEGPTGAPDFVLLEATLDSSTPIGGGTTTVADTTITRPTPKSGAPDLAASYGLTSESPPTFGSLTPDGSVYGAAFAVSASAVNQMLKAKVEAGAFSLDVTELDFGSGLVPLTSSSITALLPSFTSGSPSDPVVIEIRATMAPLLTGDPPPSGEDFEVELGGLRIGFKVLGASQSLPVQLDAKLTVGVDALFGPGGAELAMGSPIVDVYAMQNTIGEPQMLLEAAVAFLTPLLQPAFNSVLQAFPEPDFYPFLFGAFEAAPIGGTWLGVFGGTATTGPPIGAWTGPFRIDGALGSVGPPDVATDPNGNAMVVWEQVGEIYYRRFTLGGGWGGILLLETDDDPAHSPKIVSDGDGNMIVVWIQADPQGDQVMTRRFVEATGTWDPIEQLTSGVSQASDPQLGVDASGHAIVAYRSESGPDSTIEAIHYDAFLGAWNVPAQTISNLGGTLEDTTPRLAVEPNGVAMVVWLEGEQGEATNLSANPYLPGFGWSGPEGVDGTAATIREVAVVVDPGGEAIVLWDQGYSIWHRRWTGATWGPVELLETEESGAGDVHLVADGNGDLLAVWAQSFGDDYLWERRFTKSTGTWSPMEPTPSAAGSYNTVELAMNASGDAFIVYAPKGDAYLGANRTNIATAWGRDDTITLESLHSYRDSQVSVTPNGSAMAAFARGVNVQSPSSEIWVNHFCIGASCGSTFPCTEQGILDAIAAGGGPHTFSCAGPTTVVMTGGTAFIDNDVILDGGDQLTIEGNWPGRIIEVDPGVAAELRDVALTRGIDASGFEGGIRNNGTLTLTGVTMTDCHADAGGGGPVTNRGGETLTVVDSTFTGNTGTNGPGAISNISGTLEIIGSTFSGNLSSGSSGGGSRGGALGNYGTATVSGSTISGNTAQNYGGGVYNAGTLALTDTSVFSNASTANQGGGIYSSDTGSLTITGGYVDFNTASGSGGGIYSAGSFTMTDSSISNNHSTNGAGGALYNSSASPATITRAIMEKNDANGNGGGIYHSGGATLTLIDTSVNANSVTGTSRNGGGIYSVSPLVLIGTSVFGNSGAYTGGGLALLGGAPSTLVNSTIANNSADLYGAAIYSGAQPLTVISSTIAGNVAPSDLDIASGYDAILKNTVVSGDCGIIASTGLFISEGGNIESPGDTCSLTDLTDQLVADPLLGPLDLNGGPTKTIAPLPGSPAINQIDPAECIDDLGAPLTTDQRGFPRPLGGMCDVGAVEAQ